MRARTWFFVFLVGAVGPRVARGQESAVTPPPRAVVTLADAEREAALHQPQIAQARAQSSASLARAAQAESGFYPQVTATAAYARRTGNIAQQPGAFTGPPRSASFRTYDSYNFALNANQLVYDFGQTAGNYHAARASAEAQQVNETTVRLSVLLGVRTAYALAWQNHALVGGARHVLENAERHVHQIEGFVAAGARPDIDLAQVRADRANAQLSLINAESSYETAKAQLNQAMGVERSTDYDVADERAPASDGEDLDEERLVDLAVRARPELVGLQKQIEANERQISAARGGYGPSLGVAASATEAGRELDALTWNLSAGATLTWPLFQGGITVARVREAQANLEATRSQLTLERQQIRFEITQARLAIRGAKASVDTSREVEQNARERLRLAEARYQAGAGSIIELSDAETAAATAGTQVVQAEYTLSLARAQLEKGLGRR